MLGYLEPAQTVLGAPPWPQHPLAEMALFCFTPGVTAFGGPAAYIMMRCQKVVPRRQALNEPRFLDVLGATNLFPGPNSAASPDRLALLCSPWTSGLLDRVNVVALGLMAPTPWLARAGAGIGMLRAAWV